MKAVTDGIKMSLDELAMKHGTDKASNLHNYTRWYERLLPDNEDGPFITLLEIGVANGNSLRMWADYYGVIPNVKGDTIAGLDINECQPIEGVRLFKGDQSDPNILKTIIEEIGSLDVVIDDGSHLWKDQIASFKLLWPFVKRGGVYVIEDLHTSYFMEFGEPGGLSAVKFLYNMVDDMNLYGVGGLGDIRNHDQFEQLKDKLNIYQLTIESIQFFKSIVFIRKSA